MSAVPAQPGAESVNDRAPLWAWLYSPRTPWWLLPLVALSVMAPLVVNGLPETGDGRLHLMRLEVLDYHVRQGVLFPRWAPEFALGFGYPVFNFYGPSTYAVVEGLHLAGLSHAGGIIVLIGLLTLLAGTGMLRLAADLFAAPEPTLAGISHPHMPQALTAAVAYMVAPYFVTNMFMRGAVAEAAAMALLPWIFWSFRRLLVDAAPARYLLPAALSLGGLAVTHNITLLFTPPLLLSYLAVVGVTRWRKGLLTWRHLLWCGAAGGAAMLISAFFWLPLLLERGYLSTYAYYVSTYLVPYHVWTWENFLDLHWIFEYTEQAPFQLGLVQLILAVGGLLLARRRPAEWWFFAALALVVVLAMSAPAEPLWLANEYLLIVQFPWRLLALLTLPLALFTAGLLDRPARPALRAGGAGLLMALILLTQHPPLAWLDTTVTEVIDLRLPTITQYELDSGALGASLGREFMPRWTDEFVRTPVPVRREIDPATQVRLERVRPHELWLTVETPAQFKLLFTNFHFPGWRFVLHDAVAEYGPTGRLTPYPSTMQALSTVDMPAGTHRLQMIWTGTSAHHLGGRLSLAGLAALTLLGFLPRLGLRRGDRFTALAPGVLLAAGLLATLRPAPAPSAPLPVAEPAVLPGLDLLGVRVDRPGPQHLYLWPYWFVRTTPPDLLVRWTLAPTTQPESVVTETLAHPYVNSMRSASWSAGTLVDDHYLLTLPPGLPAGDYQLGLELLDETGQTVASRRPVTTVTLAANDLAAQSPSTRLDLLAGERVRLDGYDLRLQGRAPGQPGPGCRLRNCTTTTPGGHAVVRPGELVEVTAYWRATAPILENYHTFVHLVDRAGRAIAQQDQLPGPFLSPPVLWSPHDAAPDIFRLTVPADAPSGIYTPAVGIYRFPEQSRLPLHTTDGAPAGDVAALQALKIDNPAPVVAPSVEVDADLAGVGILRGYDLVLPGGGLQAGSTFTVTLHYRGAGRAAQDYTQFVQLYCADACGTDDPALRMAAQQDRPPLDGHNPTSAWLAGEQVVDVIPLQVRPDAAPGRYRLLVGLYDPADGARVPVSDAAGLPMPDNQVILAELAVE